MLQINYIEVRPNGNPSPHDAVLLNGTMILAYNGGGQPSLLALKSVKKSLEKFHCVSAVHHYIETDEEWSWDDVIAGLDDEGKLTDPHYSEPLHCPECKSDNINGGELETDTSYVWRTATCSSCGHEWKENYIFNSWDDEYEREEDEDKVHS